MKNNTFQKDKVSYCFKLHFQMLSWAGFYRPTVYHDSRMKSILYNIYTKFVFVLMILFNIQHAIFAMQSFGEMDHLIAASLILLTTMNNICKMITLYMNARRLRRILDVIDGPHFAPLNDTDTEVLKKNAKVMAFILKPCHISVVLCCTMWCIAPFINRSKGEDVVIPGYYPFNTDTIGRFSVMVIYENVVMAWVGIGHTTIDCIIASFYILIRAQLQMLRHHLLHIADNEDPNINKATLKKYDFLDINKKYSKELRRKLVYNMEKYEKINWLTLEVQLIFNNAIVMQLFVSACILCVVVYKMVQLVSLSFDFFYLFQYTCSLGIQLFLYCYFGTQAEYESSYVNDSMYASDWTSLSPKFRREMLIAMARWSQWIKPCAAYIIPLSLTTFIGVLRMSYSLYTLLKKTSN